jgi:hypothetical protein
MQGRRSWRRRIIQDKFPHRNKNIADFWGGGIRIISNFAYKVSLY